MSEVTDNTTVTIPRSLKARLDECGNTNDTYADVIKRLVDAYEEGAA